MSPDFIAAATFGSALASVRLLVLLGTNGPAIESVLVKIPAPNAVADNYWRAGNMLGAVDRDSGQIRRVVSGVGASMKTHETHPGTGAALLGFPIPSWQALRETVLAASAMFPGLRTQSWDIALTSEGLVLLEFNWGGGLGLHQFAHRRGALSESYVEHLRCCGYKGKLPA